MNELIFEFLKVYSFLTLKIIGFFNYKIFELKNKILNLSNYDFLMIQLQHLQ